MRPRDGTRSNTGDTGPEICPVAGCPAGLGGRRGPWRGATPGPAARPDRRAISGGRPGRLSRQLSRPRRRGRSRRSTNFSISAAASLARQHGFACDVVFLRGAQEEMWQKLLQLQFAPNPSEVLHGWSQAGIEATVRAYGGDLRQGFAASRDGPRTITRWTSGAAHRDECRARSHDAVLGACATPPLPRSAGCLFVHAAIDPLRPLAAQGDAFWWGA